jgi:hypothetical protein
MTQNLFNIETPAVLVPASRISSSVMPVINQTNLAKPLTKYQCFITLNMYIF